MSDESVRLDLTSPWEKSGAGGVTSPSEALLVEGLRSGEEAAYEDLVEKFQQPVFSLVSRLLNDPVDASDVTQEVFVKIFRSIGAFRGQSSLKTWVYRIAVNEAYNHRRWFRRKRGQEVGLDDEQCDGLTFEEVLTDHARSPFEVTMDHETRERIELALRTLKPAFRSAVVLRDVEGLSYEEIAEVLEISLGTVKSRILRGREALRQLLGDHLEAAPRLTLAPQGAD